MSRKTTARRVALSQEKQTLAIEWADGHESVFPLDGLRRACPCARCQGGHENMGELPGPALFREPPRREWNDVTIEPAGSYALQFTWDDGHNTGIYTWERLRAMCPCPSCTNS